jgi:hypothetical protein
VVVKGGDAVLEIPPFRLGQARLAGTVQRGDGVAPQGLDRRRPRGVDALDQRQRAARLTRARGKEASSGASPVRARAASAA